MSHISDLTLGDISRCVVIALASQTHPRYCLQISAVWEYGKSQTITSWR